MRAALALLTRLTERFPPTAPAKHALTLGNDGSLCLTLHIDGEWLAFNLVEDDLTRPIEDLVNETEGLIKAVEDPGDYRGPVP